MSLKCMDGEVDAGEALSASSADLIPSSGVSGADTFARTGIELIISLQRLTTEVRESVCDGVELIVERGGRTETR